MRTPVRPLAGLCALMFVAACSGSSTEVSSDFEEPPPPGAEEQEPPEAEQPEPPETEEPEPPGGEAPDTPSVGVRDRSLIPPYPAELELNLACFDGPSGAFVQECPVLEWGEVTYWALSHNDNRGGMTILAFDTEGDLVGTWERSGARYIWQITVDEVAETVTFWGQSNFSFSVTWEELEI